MATIFQYEMLPTTWFYLSSLMIIAIFFRFDRLWSVRNTDLIALILFTPGLLLIAQGTNMSGYIWLFGTGLLFLLRMLMDTMMVRRPLLKPNLLANAMAFTSIALFCFMLAGIAMQGQPNSISGNTIRLDQILTLRDFRHALLSNEPGAEQGGLILDVEAPGSEVRPDISEVAIYCNPARHPTPGYAPFLALSAAADLTYAPRKTELDGLQYLGQQVWYDVLQEMAEEKLITIRKIGNPDHQFSPEGQFLHDGSFQPIDAFPPNDGSQHAPGMIGSGPRSDLPPIDTTPPTEEGVTLILPTDIDPEAFSGELSPSSDLSPTINDPLRINSQADPFIANQSPDTMRLTSGDLRFEDTEIIWGDDPNIGSELLRRVEDRLAATVATVAVQGSSPYVGLSVAKPSLGVGLLVHLLVVVTPALLLFGMIWIGRRHFGNLNTGIAAATLLLLLPYTSLMSTRIDHIVPATLIVWAVMTYRRPLLSGILLGLSAGLCFFPIFLVPLWSSFYWRRGLGRFCSGLIGVYLLLLLMLLLSPSDYGTLLMQVGRMFGATSFTLADGSVFWTADIQPYRIPVIAGFCMLSGSLALWPAQKHLGVLISCSAAIMLGAQFWQASQGGLYMAWYLPLLILTIFRPNLEHLVAMTTVKESDFWFIRTRSSEL